MACASAPCVARINNSSAARIDVPKHFFTQYGHHFVNDSLLRRTSTASRHVTAASARGLI
jgi:hypothetical protein